MYVTAHERNAPINMLSRSKKTPKTQYGEGFTHMRITRDLLVATDQDGACICAHENFAHLSLFEKVSVPVKSIIPCGKLDIY